MREAVIGAWEDLKTARAIVDAAEDQTAAAQVALDSVRNEVRVGQKPMLDLLDAQRSLLAAQVAQLAAKGDLVGAGYRLNAHLAAD